MTKGGSVCADEGGEQHGFDDRLPCRAQAAVLEVEMGEGSGF